MELKVDIGFNELLQAVQQLPENQRAILRKELDKKELPNDDMTNFQKKLLNGPVMSDEEYRAFKETRKRFKNWSTK
jgi:hypothetical protein